MNKPSNKHPSIIPTPIPQVPRKPLLNITNHPHPPSCHSSSQLEPQHKNGPKLPKPRISIDTLTRPKLKQVHSRKSNHSERDRSDSVGSVCSDVQTREGKEGKEGRYCRNHRNRLAMHWVELGGLEEFCFQCSLVYAKQGYKIKPINSNTNNASNTSAYNSNTTTTSNTASNITNPNPTNPTNTSTTITQKHLRQSQTQSYLITTKTLQNRLKTWQKQSHRIIKQTYEHYGQLINNLKIRMEEEIQKVRLKFLGQVRKLEEDREGFVGRVGGVGVGVGEFWGVLEGIRVDIQRNYQDCIKSFSSKQYRTIMDQYWKQTQQAEAYLTQNSISLLHQTLLNSHPQPHPQPESQPHQSSQVLQLPLPLPQPSPQPCCQPQADLKMTVRTMQRSENNQCSEFTFSKQKKFDTPPFSKQLRGIKIVESYPDTNRYCSSLKESVVDDKICFSQFQV